MSTDHFFCNVCDTQINSHEAWDHVELHESQLRSLRDQLQAIPVSPSAGLSDRGPPRQTQARARNRVQKTRIRKQHQCPQCLATICGRRQEFVSHLARHYKREIKCCSCNQTFDRGSRFMNHLCSPSTKDFQVQRREIRAEIEAAFDMNPSWRNPIPNLSVPGPGAGAGAGAGVNQTLNDLTLSAMFGITVPTDPTLASQFQNTTLYSEHPWNPQDGQNQVGFMVPNENN